jgi:hypothetical protein
MRSFEAGAAKVNACSEFEHEIRNRTKMVLFRRRGVPVTDKASLEQA